MPVGVVDRARELLVELERRPKHGPPTRQLSLFAPAPPPPPPPDPVADALRAAVVALRPDELSPREALQALYTLKALAEGS
jgi:DNA mismatch repair protein MutS